jgi:hypothetical protein
LTKTQHKKFIDAAKQAGVSDDEADFDRALAGIAKAPPPETVQDRKKPKPETKKLAK